jgi:hypothetical protein
VDARCLGVAAVQEREGEVDPLARFRDSVPVASDRVVELECGPFQRHAHRRETAGRDQRVTLRRLRDVLRGHPDRPVARFRALDADGLDVVPVVGGAARDAHPAGEHVAEVERAAGGLDLQVEVIDQVDRGGRGGRVVGPAEHDAQRLGVVEDRDDVLVGRVGGRREPPLDVVDDEPLGVPREVEGVVEQHAAPTLRIRGRRRGHVLHRRGRGDQRGLDECSGREEPVVRRRRAAGMVARGEVLAD